MALLTAGLAARVALPNLHKLDWPLPQLLLSCAPKRKGVSRREERKKGEEKDKEN